MANRRNRLAAAVLALVVLLAPRAGAADAPQTAPVKTPLQVTYYFLPG
jgi:hypothetical protein